MSLKMKKRITAIVLAVALIITGLWNDGLFPLSLIRAGEQDYVYVFVSEGETVCAGIASSGNASSGNVASDGNIASDGNVASSGNILEDGKLKIKKDLLFKEGNPSNGIVEKEGYSIKGWMYKNEGSEFVELTSVDEIEDGTVIYASWEFVKEEDFQLPVEGADKDLVSNLDNVEINVTATEVEIKNANVEDGYLVEWFENAECTKPVTSTTDFANPIYPKVKLSTYLFKLDSSVKVNEDNDSLVYVKELTKEALKYELTKTANSAGDKIVANIEVDEANQKFKIYLSEEDGSQSSDEFEIVAMLDTVAPVISNTKLKVKDTTEETEVNNITYTYPNWTNEALVFSFDVTDEGAGVSEVSYKLGDKEEVLTGSNDSYSIEIPKYEETEQKAVEYEVEITVKDNVDNVDDTIVYKLTVNRDKKAPEIKVEASEDYTNEDMVLDVNVNDGDGSGINTEETKYSVYTVENGEDKEYKAESKVIDNKIELTCADGESVIYKVVINAKDNCENPAATKEVIVKFDKVKPNFALEYNKNWNKGDNGYVTILTAEDKESGLATPPNYGDIEANRENVTSIEKVNETVEGKVVYKYKVIPSKSAEDVKFIATLTDNAGNVAEVPVTMKFDIDAPTLNSINIVENDTLKELQGAIINGQKNIKLVASDATTNVSILYKLNNNDFTEIKTTNKDAEEVITVDTENLTDGENKLSVKVVDEAGNESSLVEKTFIVDNAGPNISYVYADANNWVNKENPTISVNISDVYSKINTSTIKYAFSYEPDKKYTIDETKLTVSPDGKTVNTVISLNEKEYMYGVRVWVDDELSNASTAETEEYIAIDRSDIAAEFSYDNFGKWVNENDKVIITLSAKGGSKLNKDSVKYRYTYQESSVENKPTNIEEIDNGKKLKFEVPVDARTEKYRVVVNVSNVAGTGKEIESGLVAVDKVNPTVTSEYVSNGWINILNNNQKIVFTIADGESGIKKITTKYVYENSSENFEKFCIDFTEEGNFDEIITIPTTELPDGEYKLVVSAEDISGNPSNVVEIPIQKDTVKASGDIKIKEDSWSEFFNKITFGIFEKDLLEVALTVNNDVDAKCNYSTSKIEKVEYLRTNVIYSTEEECGKALGWTECTSNAGTNDVYKTIFTVDLKEEKNQNLIVYVRITDTAGNVKYINSNGVVLDSNEPVNDLSVPMVEVDGNNVTPEIYNESLKWKFTVEDPEVDGVVSGIEYVEYYVENGDTREESERIKVEVTKVVLDKYGKKTIEDATKEILKEARLIELEVEVPIEKFNSNNVKIIVNAKDNAGNIMDTKELPLMLDNTKPTVNVSYDNNDVKNNEYFDKDRVMTVTVTERNFDAENTKIIITKDGVESVIIPAIDSWTLVEGGVANGDANTYTYKHIFADDADYTVAVECTDKAGNTCEEKDYVYEGVATQKFTIDKINPVINSDAKAGIYCEKQTVLVNIIEHNFLSENVEVYVTRKINEDIIYENKEYEVDWKAIDGEKDKYQAEIVFEEKGTYTFNVKCKDMSDLKAQYYFESITIDIEAPIITFNPEEINEWINENNIKSDDENANINYPKIKVTVDDEISGLKSIGIKIKRYNGEKLVEEIILKECIDFSEECYPNESWSYDILTEELPDGQYVIEAVSKDKYDNESLKTFNINKDTEKPTGEILIKENTWNDFIDTITFGLFSNDTVDVELNVKDYAKKGSVGNSSGIQKVEYLRTDVIYLTKEECGKASGWIDCTNQAGKNEYKTIFTVNPKEEGNEDLITYVRITDTAGNIKYISSNGVVLDSNAPIDTLEAPKVDIKGKLPINKIYNDDLNWSFTVEDPEVDGVFSGIKYVKYYVINEDTGYATDVKEIKVTEDVLNDKTIDKATKEILKEASIIKDLVVDIPIADFNSNNVEVRVDAEDNAGNIMATKVLELQLDNTKPTVKVTYDNNTVGGYDKFFTDNRVMTVTVTERNFDPANTKIIITKDGVESVLTPEWKYVGNRTSENGAVNGDADTYTCTYVFKDEADYTVDVECTDKAGNKCESYVYEGNATQEFTIDKTSPVITEYDIDGFYKEKTYEVTITEHNFSEEDAEIIVYRKEKTGEYFSEEKLSKDSLNWIHDGDEHSVILSFNQTGDYYFKVEVTDKAGLTDEYTFGSENKTFTIDNTIPKITLQKYDDTEEYKKDWINMYNGDSVRIDVNVRDDFDGLVFAGLASIDVRRVYGDKSETLPIGKKFDVNNRTGIEYISITPNYLPDGEYDIVVTAIDKAGNEITEKIHIKKDTQQAIGNIKIKDSIWENVFNTVTFGIFSNDSVEINVSVKDDAKEGSEGNSSGIKKVEYLRTDKVYDLTECMKRPDNEWIDCTTKVGKDGNYGTIDEADISKKNENLIVYVRITDKAGNVKYISSNGIVLDSEVLNNDLEAPKVDIIGENPSNNIYSDSLQWTFKVTDPIRDNGTDKVVSGIKSVKYYVINEDTGYATDVKEIKVTENVLNKYGKPLDKATKDILKEASEIEVTVDVPIVNFNSNNVKVVVDAIDNADNQMDTKELPLQLDNTKPVVNVSYDNNTVGGYEKFFKADRTMTVTVTERNFAPANTKIIITKDGVESVISPAIADWAYVDNRENGAVNGDADTYTFKQPFNVDADYTVKIECTDLAGNSCESYTYAGTATQEFTVDKTKPVISADNVSGYYSQTVNVAVNINEHNFAKEDAKIFVTKKLNGNVLYTNQVYDAVWTDNGDTHNTVVTLSEDGDYTFSITYTDKAGNEAVEYVSQEFSVDNVDPILSSNVSSENKNIANKGDINFVYTYTDINSSNDGGMIKYSVSTLSGKSVEWNPTIENINVDGVNGYKITFKDVASSTSLKDGIYVISVDVKDKAGRSVKETKQFSVNRRGSAYDYEKESYLAKVVSLQYVQSVDEDIVIQVMNCDDITGYQVIIFNSLNEQRILKEGTDYKWELVGENIDLGTNVAEAGYKKYVCTVFKSVFAENGTYNIRVLTKDNADDSLYGDDATLISNVDAVEGNATEIAFTVDNIKPEVILIGLKNGESYDLATDMKIDYSDTNNIKTIVVRRLDKDGKVLETKEFTAEEIKAAGESAGRLIFNVKEYDGFQTIEVIVTDVAGNEETKTIKVLITSNAWVKFINNTPLLIGSIVGVILLLAVIILLIAKKKKKQSN